jgi:hypothetical protein
MKTWIIDFVVNTYENSILWLMSTLVGSSAVPMTEPEASLSQLLPSSVGK